MKLGQVALGEEEHRDAPKRSTGEPSSPPCPPTVEPTQTSEDTSQTNNPLRANPAVLNAIEAATGLSSDDLYRVIDGLADAGVALALRPNAESEARYGHALSLLNQGWGLRAAAREVWLDHSNLRKKILRNREVVPDAEKRHQAAEERILTLAEELSEAAAEKLVADVEADRLRPADLVKTFSAATNQVAAKRRWAKDVAPSGQLTKNALAEALENLRVTIEPADPTSKAIDVTPEQTPGSKDLWRTGECALRPHPMEGKTI